LACVLLCAGARAQAPEPRAQRIDIDLVRADLHDVLRLLAEIGGVNLVLGEGVAGQVTLKLERVRWQDALRSVLATHGLELEQRGNVLLVARTERFAERRAQQLTEREQCQRSAPLRTRIVPVNYASSHALAALVRDTLSERGSVQVDQRTNSLIVRDVDCP
jgi:type IV pilus assembly protein PilQ